MYISGTYYQICDICGFRYRNTATKLNWKKQVVCGGCWEPKHPQLEIRTRKDNQNVPFPRPEGDPVYTSTSSPVTADDL